MKIRILLGLVCIASSVHGQTIASLSAQVKALQGQVSYLQSQVVTLQKNPALQLGRYVSVSPDPQNGVTGPNITFSGANVHIVSGSGYTGDHYTGLGNLIIGYNEAKVGELASGDRGGSHNLVIGRYNKFLQGAFGGIVQGDMNQITCEENVALGGGANVVTGSYAVVIGGSSNTSASFLSVALGGFDNTTGTGSYQLMLGGCANALTTDEFSSVLGINNGTTIGLHGVQ